MAAAQVDVPRLAAYVSLPVDHLTTLTTAPTVDLVQALLVKLEQKATQHEEVAAQKIRAEVELENVIRAGEQKSRLMKANLEKAQKQAIELQQQLEAEQTSRQSLAAELESIKTSASTSGADLITQQQRISSLEAANRDTLSLLEAKSRAHDGLAQDLSAKHQKTVELRKEVSDLEDKVRAAATASSSARFREQALEQEVESLKRSNDYLDTELKTKNTEYAKFRKDKNARVAELQRQHEDDATTIESLQRSEKALRSRAVDLEQKAEDYLSQVQQVKEELSRQEENFRSELDTANRLQELMKEQAETEKNRRAELQEQYETIQDEAREEFAKIEEEMRTVQEDKDTAERRVSELEEQVERLEADITTISAAPVAASPRFNGSVRPGSAPRTPLRGMSPSAPGSAMRSSMNYTQLVTEYHDVRKERDNLRRRNDELATQVDTMNEELGQHAPVLDQMQQDHKRLQADVGEMSALIESIGKEREAAKKEARSCQGKVKGLQREGEILRQQLRDLSSQIKVLLLEVNARDQGQDSFTPDERVRLEQLARGEDAEREYHDDTDRFISQHLVTFKNTAELQAQNEKLLRVTRELGDKMEGEEAQAAQTQAAQDHEEVQELRQKYDRVRDEMKSLMTQSQAYIRERDIFRRMLSHRGQLPPQSDLESAFGQSVNGEAPFTPARNGLHASVEMSPASKDVADYNKLIKEMQSHFDGYKQETSSERSLLKEQVSSLTTSNGELRNELAKKNGEVSLAIGRYEMLQGNYTMLKTENGELQKRSQAASDRATQQDLRVQAVAEELVETRTTLESLRGESANLKAEKEFWKTIEKRLTDDNQSLIADRDRLNTLNSNLQNLLNEREHAENESRRRLHTQIEMLEAEIQTTKRKLSEAEEESKRNAFKREFDSQQTQIRLDDLVKTVSSTREELSGAKATRDQLQLRVDELTIELRSAEERLQVLSSRSEATSANNDQTNAGQDQDLALQSSELKRDLELAKRDLVSAQEQIEQYRQISQGSEEELQSLNESHDQYREEMDRLVQEKEAKVTELEGTIETMRREADESATELETLRTEKENHDRALREQKAQLDTEINRFKDAAERAETAAQFHQEDLKAQAEIARQAQENYDTELQKHAEASRTLQIVRTEFNEAKLELVELRSARDAAQSALSQAEDNLHETRTRYDGEVAEIRARRQDVDRQNKLLHEQLEKVNNQITDLQRARTASGVPAGSPAVTGSEDGNLQELIRYLRREKEIVDVQYEMANQEARRLRQQLEHTQSQLEDVRLKLSQQLRSEEDRERNTLNHNKLIETINELNLIRESNATLRLEKGQAQTQLAQRNKDIEELQNQLPPLHAKVQELEDIRESLEQELRMTREARERFEQRYHDLLNKTDSIDPAELESLKEKHTVVETERDELKQQTNALQEELDGVPAKIEGALSELREQHQTLINRIKEQAKNKNSQQVAKINEAKAATQTVTEEKDKLQAQLDAAKKEYADIQTRLEQAEAGRRHSKSPSASAGDISQIGALQEQLSQANVKAEESAGEVTELRQQLASVQTRVSELEQELESAESNLAQTQSQIAEAAQAQPTAAQPALDTAQIDQLRKELATAQQDAEALRAAATVNERAATVQEGEGQDSIADQITRNVDAIRAELEARHEDRVAAAEVKATARVEEMKNRLNARLKEFKTTETERLKTEFDQQVEQINEQHRAEIDGLKSRHQSELDELKHQLSLAAPKKDVNGTQEPSTPATPTALNLPTSLDSADDVKKLLQSSEVAKRILSSNISKKVTETKEAAAKELEEKLAEAETNAKAVQEAAIKQARESATELESKKQQLKLSMATNKLKQAEVKITYVQTAAKDTPDQAVSAVWDVAKDLKPQPAASGGLTNSVFAPSNASTPAKAPTAQPLQAASVAKPAQANPFAQTSAATGNVPSPAPAANPFAKVEPQVSEAAESQIQTETSAQPQADKTEGQSSIPGPSRPSSSHSARLPDGSLPSGLARGGRGGAQSALPVPGGRGQNQRGGFGRGNRGRGRGSGIPQPGAQGNLNASAKQFIPQKRGLEASDHAGPDKRQRGGKN